MSELLAQLKAELELVQQQLTSTPMSHQPLDAFIQLRARERGLQAQIASLEDQSDPSSP